MGSSYHLACRTCQVDINLGYGSFRTWIIPFITGTVEGFDAMADKYPESERQLHKNQMVRKAVAEHEGHDFCFWAGDFHSRQDDDLVFDQHPYEPPSVVVEGWVHYRKENWDAQAQSDGDHPASKEADLHSRPGGSSETSETSDPSSGESPIA